MESSSKQAETPYGFVWNNVTVERLGSIERKGGTWRVIIVKTDKRALEIYVTPTGLLRVFENGKRLNADKSKSSR